MNKKIVYAMGLTAMMAACNSEDVLTDVKNSQESDLFAGIEKVSVDFSMEVESRLAETWGLEVNDRVGLAWLNDGNGNVLETTGAAYQNHPLYATSATNLKPKTSIYVGEYFSYAPYDETVVSIENINFQIPAADMLSSWNGLAKNAIYISPRWTTVTKSGVGEDGKAGIDNNFTIYPKKFSNGVALDFTYENHEINLKDETNNNTPYESDSEIFDATVSYVKDGETVSINKFQYAPTTAAISDNDYDDEGIRSWENFKLAENSSAEETAEDSGSAEVNSVEVKNEVKGGYFLDPSSTYIASRELEGDKFYMNALPAMADVDENTKIKIVINTTYGCITVEKPINKIAKTAYETGYKQYFDGVDKDENGNDLEADECTKYTESFVQLLGKNGKFETEVDFSTAVMNGMHVRDDAHLVQLLRYYRDYKLGTDYEEEEGVTLYLDADGEGEFKISKTSIALMQSINVTATDKIKLMLCEETDHGEKPVVVVTNTEKEGKEIPTFNKVFGENVNVYLEDQEWTWNATSKRNTGRVNTIYNRGDLTVGSTNVEAGNSNLFEELVNLAGAEIKFTEKVATLWKINLTNHGAITIPASAQMRVYSTVVNDVTEITGVRSGSMGEVINYGVFGAIEDSEGTISNYGKIYHQAGAKTFVTNNELNEDFANAMSVTNKIGIIEMEQADANVSVSNATSKGIIAYNWPKDVAVYESPAVVRYNYLIVEGNIEFGTENEEEIKYLEVAGEDVYVTNKAGVLKNLKAVVVDYGKALNITEGNKLKPAKAAYIKGYVYNGGEFTYNNDLTTYFGGLDTDKENILKWSGK